MDENRVAQPIQVPPEIVVEAAAAEIKEKDEKQKEEEKKNLEEELAKNPPPPAQRIIKDDRKLFKNEAAAQKPFLEKLTAEASNNTNFIYKVLLLVFAILTAIAAGGWAITSNSKRKSLRRSALAWAWGTALALFLCLVFLCLIIAFPSNTTGKAEGAVGEKAQVSLPGAPVNGIGAPGENTGAQFKAPTFIVDDTKSNDRNDWAAMQKKLGLNLKNMEGPRANYRSHPEIVQRYPEPLVPLEQFQMNQEDYEEYMRSIEGYNRPEEFKGMHICQMPRNFHMNHI